MEPHGHYPRISGVHRLLIALGVLALAFLLFMGGMFAGYRRARFEYRLPGPWGMHTLPHMLIRGGHGAIGTLKAAALPTLTLIARDGSSQKIVVASTTLIRNEWGDASTSALVPGAAIIVIGDSADAATSSAIQARFIRILPPPPPNYNAPSF